VAETGAAGQLQAPPDGPGAAGRIDLDRSAPRLDVVRRSLW
jgi:hypothetical protein